MIRNILSTQKELTKIAIIYENKHISYQDIITKTSAIQNHILKNKETIISIYLEDNIDYIETLLAVVMAGLTAFPLNPMLKKHEIIPLFEKAQVNTIITSRNFYKIFEGIKSHHIPNLKVIYIEDINLRLTALPTYTNINPDKSMFLLNTSGTTGKCKIVQLSEKNLEASVLGYIAKMDFSDNNIKYLVATPLSSAYGLMILFVCLMKSFPIILLKEGFTLETFYKTIYDYKVTNYEGGSTILQIMEQTLEKPLPYNISSLRYFGFGGSKLSSNSIKSLLRAYPNSNFWQGYGMTETSPLITKYSNKNHEKLDSVGTAIKNVEIFIETNKKIHNRPYTKGEILVKGPNVMLGYYKNEEETNKIIRNGYLYTGDIGYLDEEGYLYICGRKKNIIIVRGLNIYPEELESSLLNSSFVRDCVVYGETDSFGDETICVDIVPINSEVTLENIKTYCTLNLSTYKQPTKIKFVNKINKGMSGKTKRLKGGV